MALTMTGRDLLAQVHLVDAIRIVEVFLIAPNDTLRPWSSK